MEKKNIRKILVRVTGMCLTCALLVTGSLHVTAADDAEVAKDETVYAVLSADGTAASMTDSVWLHSAGSLQGHAEKTGLNDVRLLNDIKADQADGTITFATDIADAYYQGTSDQQLPVSVAVTYDLDGQAMTAQQLQGKSGHLTISFAFTNNRYAAETIDGTARRVYTPYVAVVGATLDNDTFTNVVAAHGTVKDDSAKRIAGFVCLPGLKETYDGLLTGKLASLGDYLRDKAVLECDVKDFSMPDIYIACATDAKQLSGLDGLDDYQSVFDDLDKLQTAMDALIQGGQQLVDGSAKLDAGAHDLYDGLTKLSSGASQVQTGATKVSKGAQDAYSGAAQLAGGLAALSNNSQSIRTGVKNMADAILASVNQQLKTEGVISQDMTWDDYATVLSGPLNVTDQMRAAAAKTIHDQVLAQTGTDLSDAQLNALVYLTAVDSQHDIGAAGKILDQAAKDTAASGAIYVAQAALIGAAAGSSSVKATAVSAVRASLLEQGYQAVKAQLPAAQADLIIVMAVQAMSADSSLKMADAMQSAAVELTVAAGQQALAAAGSAQAVPAVAAIASSLVSAGSYQDADAAYAAMLQQAGGQPLLVVMAAQAAQGQADGFAAALTSSSATLQAYAASGLTAAQLTAAIQKASDSLTAAGGSAKGVTAVQPYLVEAAYASLLADSQMASAAKQAMTLKYDGGTVATTAADVMLTMAVQAGGSLKQALATAGAKLTNASVAATALAKANDQSDTQSQQLIKGYLTQLVTAESQDALAQVLKQLNSVRALVSGVDEYTKGVDDAATGAATLADGLADLKSGAATLAAGAASVKSGADALTAGAADLQNGSDDLNDGLQQMYDGLVKFNAEGLSRLTSGSDIEQLKKVLDVTDAVSAARKKDQGYVGQTHGEMSSRYVMRLDDGGTKADATTTAAKLDAMKGDLSR